MEPCHLFVYGTLRKTAFHPMHALLLPADLVGQGSFQGRLYDLGNYPGAVSSGDPLDTVRGDVYRLHEPVLTLVQLDRYEACAETDPRPHEYFRTMVPIRLESGEIIPSLIYLYGRQTGTLTRIQSGDYLTWLTQRST